MSIYDNIIDVTFSLVGTVVNIILAPINALITAYLPNMNAFIARCNLFFDNLVDYANWFLSYTGIPQTYLNFIISAWVFILTLPLLVNSFKIAIQWFSHIKIG